MNKKTENFPHEVVTPWLESCGTENKLELVQDIQIAELQLADGKGINHDEALKQILTW